MAESYVTGETLIGEIVTQYPEAVEVLLSIGMHCCPSVCTALAAPLPGRNPWRMPALCTECPWTACWKPSTPKSPKPGNPASGGEKTDAPSRNVRFCMQSHYFSNVTKPPSTYPHTLSSSTNT